VSELPVVSQSVLDIVLIRIGIQHNVRMIYDSKKDRSHRCLIISRNGNTGQPDSASLLLAASCGISSWASGLEIGNSYRSAWYLVSVSSGTGLNPVRGSDKHCDRKLSNLISQPVPVRPDTGYSADTVFGRTTIFLEKIQIKLETNFKNHISF
jgi:hypothetical protein